MTDALAQGDTAQALRDAAWLESIEMTNSSSLLRARIVIAGVLGDYHQVSDLMAADEFEWNHWWGERVDMLLDPLRDYVPFQELMRTKG